LALNQEYLIRNASVNKYALALFFVALSLVFYVLSVQIRIGVPYWDVFNFLNNALYFAGMGNSGVGTSFLPPLIPLITSLFFRLGLVSATVIFAVSAGFLIAGVMGLYFLFNLRFSEVQSFTGSLIFLSLAVLMPWSASGGIDIPAVSLSIWAIYFLVKGMDNRPRLLYLLIPTLGLALLARYTAGLILIPLVLYFFMKSPTLKQLKGILLGFLITLIASIPFIIYFYQKLSNFEVVYMLFVSTATGLTTGTGDVAYNTNPFYYVQHILNYISMGPFQGAYVQLMNPSQGQPSVVAYVMVIIVVIGLIFYLYQTLRTKVLEIKKQGLKYNSYIKLVLLTAIAIIFFITLNQTSYLFSEVLLLALFYLIYISLKGRGSEYLALDLMFMSWFLAFLIFHSNLPIKVDRYFITMVPALAYFLILGLTEFLTTTSLKIKKPTLKSKWVYIAIAMVFLLSTTVTYAGHTPKKIFVLYLEDSSNWITEQDPQYREKVIISDYPNAMSWYMKKLVLGGFPRFFNTSGEFAQYLKSQNADYYVDSLSNPKPDLNGYHPVKTFQMVTIYQKN